MAPQTAHATTNSKTDPQVPSTAARPRARGRLCQPRLPQGAGGFRAHDHRAARARLRDRAGLCSAPTWWWSTPAASSMRAIDESLQAIGEALEQQRPRAGHRLPRRQSAAHPRPRHPKVLGVTGPHAYERVMAAVQRASAAPARAVPRPGAAAGHPPDAAALCVSQDLRRLQQPLQLLHHPGDARRSGEPAAGSR